MSAGDRVKRALDVVLAGGALVVLSPVLVAVAVAVRVKLGTPVLFRQERPGRNGMPFTMLKFRSMRDARDAGGRPLPDAARMTRFSRWLRASSLDELPELWNVVRGDMSLVGPRPLLPEYLPLYSERHARRHLVRPGLTGWAQVNGRNALGWNERLDLDSWYVEHRTLGLDLRILVMTLATVFSRRGVSQPGHSTMEPFRGYGD